MKGNWLFNRRTDLFLLGLPVWLCWIVFFLLPDRLIYIGVPLWVWVVFILGIDVSHVWSMIFRTYLDPEEFSRHKLTLCLTPIIVFIFSFGVAFLSSDWFWRILAYLAVFHFIKQQYGFMMLYKTRSGDFNSQQVLPDKWVIYLSMFYPLAHWHLVPKRNFSWFIENDFIFFHQWFHHSWLMFMLNVANILYWLIILGWVGQEVWVMRKVGMGINTGKIIWVLTTASNWYLGIIFFNSDLVFSVSNVVAHGVPYLVLITWYVIRKRDLLRRVPLLRLIRVRWVLLIIGGSLLLAFFEEYGWDLFLNGEKRRFFSHFLPYSFEVLTNPIGRALATAILSLPQITHYIIDGVIWKNNKKNPHLKPILEIGVNQ
tara:strand:- start:85 stop:1197 length:1113 start_codon:yes stop_codon:yes gene_type:complete